MVLFTQENVIKIPYPLLPWRQMSHESQENQTVQQAVMSARKHKSHTVSPRVHVRFSECARVVPSDAFRQAARKFWICNIKKGGKKNV